ncbi:protein root UVB sensitive 5 isoform X2 [Amaranthus tricolor]|uniref:protein root UVB sensitive 5 isoform X2 n=1 Tax=Amaranthus tricolor TaxID=29722 RepID=UPI00258F8A92|nr:protein root UVB sensitive 5 isoform X2 [Amaranthus tricolor]
MSDILHCCISNFVSAEYGERYLLKRSTNINISFRCRCLSSTPKSNPQDEDSGNQSSFPFVLVERYTNGTAKRYILDGESTKQTLLEPHETVINESNNLNWATNLNWLPDSIKDFVLPAGYPDSVSDDYLEYMLWQLPTNITGWICHALVTSSLLKAVGVGSFSGSTAAASAAAIRWVSKDGIGAVGRLIIGGRFGNLFDDDPKQWRMYADFIGSAGSIFDLSTQLYPAYFLPLASLGNLAKAVARGLKDPSFRVIQNHFALSGNLGDVSAKEEVWEVTAQLFGLALGILILDTPGLVKSYAALLSTWMSVRLFHLWLRYKSLSVLQFNTINLKRARMLAKAHVLHSEALGCIDCNRQEDILSWQRFLRPRIIFGVPFSDVISVGRSFTMVEIFKLYTKETYVLTVDQWQMRDFKVLVSFKVGATSLSVLRSVWQAYWLCEHWDRSMELVKALEESLSNLEQRFDKFMVLLEDAGWNTQKLNLKVPKEPYIELDVDFNN